MYIAFKYKHNLFELRVCINICTIYKGTLWCHSCIQYCKHEASHTASLAESICV
jgi:hypothetical protein